MKKIIVSAADSNYYELLIDLISSIEDSKGDFDVAIGVLDIGLTAEQHRALSERIRHVVTPAWDYPVPTSATIPQHRKAMTARPHLPKYFPGYDIIMWMDADTWVQKWSAVEVYLHQANTGLAICQEMDRSYANIYNLNNSRQLFLNSLKAAFDEQILQRVFWMPMVNSGVFAMRADCHYWSEWSDIMGAALQRSQLDHFTEQTSLNVCVYRRLPFPYFMPPRYNWVCVHALPVFDKRKQMYVEPLAPHDEISIVHLTGLRTRIQDSIVVVDEEGNDTEMNLLYSQWKRYRNQHPN